MDRRRRRGSSHRRQRQRGPKAPDDDRLWRRLHDALGQHAEGSHAPDDLWTAVCAREGHPTEGPESDDAYVCLLYGDMVEHLACALVVGYCLRAHCVGRDKVWQNSMVCSAFDRYTYPFGDIYHTLDAAYYICWSDIAEASANLPRCHYYIISIVSIYTTPWTKYPAICHAQETMCSDLKNQLHVLQCMYYSPSSKHHILYTTHPLLFAFNIVVHHVYSIPHVQAARYRLPCTAYDVRCSALYKVHTAYSIGCAEEVYTISG